MPTARFEISEMRLPRQRYWLTADARKGTQCGNLSIGVGTDLFSHSLDPEQTAAIDKESHDRIEGAALSIRAAGRLLQCSRFDGPSAAKHPAMKSTSARTRLGTKRPLGRSACNG